MKKLLQAAIASIGILFAGMATAGGFDGLYVGASVGTNTYNASSSTATSTISGTTLSGYAGYNYMINENFMLGAEAGISNHNLGSSGLITDRKIDNTYAGLRAGYVMDKMMPYLTAGLMKSRYSSTTSGVTTTNDVSNESYLGLGLEYLISNNLVGRIEYRTETSKYTVGSNTLDLKNDNISIGVSYSF